MPSIYDTIKASANYDALKNELQMNTCLSVEEVVLSNEKVLFIRQNDKTKPGIQSGTSLIAVSETKKIVIAALPKMNDMLLDTSPAKKELNESKYISVEEWFYGEYVAVSLHKHVHVISTEKDNFAKNKIPYTQTRYCDFVLDEMDKIDPYKAIDMLDETDPDLIWIFNVAPIKNDGRLIMVGELKHELILIGCIRKTTMHVISRTELALLGKLLKIKVPKYRIIYSMADFDRSVESLVLLENNIKGVICRSVVNNDWADKYELDADNKVEFLYSQGKKNLYAITNMILNGKRVEAIKEYPNFIPLIIRIGICLDKFIREMNEIHSTYSKVRTKKKYAENVIHHPLFNVLFRFRDTDEITLPHIQALISPKKLIQTINTTNKNHLEDSIKKCKEKAC